MLNHKIVSLGSLGPSKRWMSDSRLLFVKRVATPKVPTSVSEPNLCRPASIKSPFFRALASGALVRQFEILADSLTFASCALRDIHRLPGCPALGTLVGEVEKHVGDAKTVVAETQGKSKV